MKRVARFITRLVAIIVLAVATPAVAVGTLLVLVNRSEGPCDCPGAPVTPPTAIFSGKVLERVGDSLRFEVSNIEMGLVTDTDLIEAPDVELAPWRRYRVEVFTIADHRFVSSFDPPRPEGLTMPSGTQAFGALRRHSRAAVGALPLFLLSASYLLVSSYRQAQREDAGVFVSGLRRLRRARPGRAAIRRRGRRIEVARQ